jgi:hypothetical protein
MPDDGRSQTAELLLHVAPNGQAVVPVLFQIAMLDRQLVLQELLQDALGFLDFG